MTQTKTETNRGLGTKAELRAWLQAMKKMTYTKYSSLTTPAKAEIMQEYRKKLQTNRSTVIVEEKRSVQHV